MIIRLLRNVCIPPHPTIHYFLLLKIFKSHYRSKKIFICCCWLLFCSITQTWTVWLTQDVSGGATPAGAELRDAKPQWHSSWKQTAHFHSQEGKHDDGNLSQLPPVCRLRLYSTHLISTDVSYQTSSWRMLNGFEFVTAIYSSVFTSRSLVEWRLWCGKIGSDSFPAQISADSQQRLKNGFSPWFSVLWPLTRLFNSHTPPVCQTHHSGRSLSCSVGLLNGPENILVTG